MSNLRTESVGRTTIVTAQAVKTKLVTVIYMYIQSKYIVTIIIACKISRYNFITFALNSVGLNTLLHRSMHSLVILNLVQSCPQAFVHKNMNACSDATCISPLQHMGGDNYLNPQAKASWAVTTPMSIVRITQMRFSVSTFSSSSKRRLNFVIKS